MTQDICNELVTQLDTLEMRTRHHYTVTPELRTVNMVDEIPDDWRVILIPDDGFMVGIDTIIEAATYRDSFITFMISTIHGGCLLIV